LIFEVSLGLQDKKCTCVLCGNSRYLIFLQRRKFEKLYGVGRWIKWPTFLNTVRTKDVFNT